MILKIYSVYDSAAKAYMAPFYMHHDSEAVRLFKISANNPGSPFNSSPGDYTLFNIGEFDDSEGMFVTGVPKNLGLALHLMEQKTVELPDDPELESIQSNPTG